MVHARRINKSNGWTGHLWANRFYSSPEQPEAAKVVARYIELNPVRARMTPTPEAYSWSSARAHCTHTPDPLLSRSRSLAPDAGRWQIWLQADFDRDTDDKIRRSTETGTPIGNSAYIEALERVLDRKLRRRSYRSRDGN